MTTKRRINMQLRASDSENLQPEHESKYCRTCLATEDLDSIFCNKETEEKRSHDLKLVTGLEIKVNDGLSQRICTQCTDTINICLRFRRACRKAERALLKMGTNPPVKVKKKYKQDKEDNKKYRIQKPTPPVMKSEVEIEVVPVDIDFSYDDFDEQFQTDYDYKENVKSDVSVVKEETPVPRKKRIRRAPASSYKCATCHKVFYMMATYKAHMRFHTNFCVCESCGKRCRNNNQLQEHKRARHGLGRIHKCAYCEYSSATKEALIIHERRHTGERPYVCDHCGATFHRRSNLVQHIAIHLPEKNWQCDMCPKRLKSKKFLQIHKHNAHTGKRYGYLCGVCAHRFEKPNKVRAHTRRVHGVPDDEQGPITRVQL